MRKTLAIAAAFPLLFPAESLPPIKSVVLHGPPPYVSLATQVGQPFDAARISQDVRLLWHTGRFSDIRVRAEPENDGTNIVFDLTSLRTLELHQVRVVPAVAMLQVKLPEGTPMDSARAYAIAGEAQRRLRSFGYTGARVTYKLEPFAGNQVDLVLHPEMGNCLRIADVRITGDPGLPITRLRGELHQTRIRRLLPPLPGLREGWRLLPAYSQDAVEADLARLRSLYLAEGYYDARVLLDSVEIGNHAKVAILVRSGARHEPSPSTAGVCQSLLAQRRQAERQGILDFSARLRVPEMNVTVERGRPYRLGRIEFTGLHHFKDAGVRRNLLLDEGQPLDEYLLRKSLARIDRSRMFEPVDAGNAAIHTNERSGTADVTIHLVERKRGAWNLSGPAGPASLAGPLEVSISARLPRWSTYVASISLIAFSQPLLPALSIAPKACLLPVAAISRPFTPVEGWQSGFLIAPQLGWRATAVSYGTTQLQQRALARLDGDSALISDLPVTVEGPAGERVMFCEAPKPRMHTLRVGVSVALRLLGMITGG